MATAAAHDDAYHTSSGEECNQATTTEDQSVSEDDESLPMGNELKLQILRKARAREKKRITEAIKLVQAQMANKECVLHNYQKVTVQREVIVNLLETCLKFHEEIINIPGFQPNEADNIHVVQTKVEAALAGVDAYINQRGPFIQSLRPTTPLPHDIEPLQIEKEQPPMVNEKSMVNSGVDGQQPHVLTSDEAERAVQAIPRQFRNLEHFDAEDADSSVSTTSSQIDLRLQLLEERNERRRLENALTQAQESVERQALELSRAQSNYQQLEAEWQLERKRRDNEEQERQRRYEREQKTLREENALALERMLERIELLEQSQGSTMAPSHTRRMQNERNQPYDWERTGGVPKKPTTTVAYTSSYFQSPGESSTKNSIRFRSSEENQVEVNQSRSGLSLSPRRDSGERHRSLLFRPPKLEIEQFDGDPLKWHDFAVMFRDLVESSPQFTRNDKMALLRHCLKPNVRKFLGECLNNSALYDEALEQLEQMFGHPHVLADSYVRTIMSLPALKTRDYKPLMDFSASLRGAVASLRAIECRSELESSALLSSLVDKLPDSLKSKWGKKIVKAYPCRLTLEDFDSWLHDIVKAEMVVKHPLFTSSSSERKLGKESGNRPGVYATSQPIANGNSAVIAEGEIETIKRTCPVCKGFHGTEKCSVFIAMSIEERIVVVRDHMCCLRCLRPGHRNRNCYFKRKCGIDGCRQSHHFLLHGAPRIFPATGEDESTKTRDAPVANIGTTNLEDEDNPVLLAVVPIKLCGEFKTVDAYALLDTGAETTLITEDLAKLLNLPGVTKSYCIGTFHGEDPSFPARKVSFELTPRNKETRFDVPAAYTVPAIKLSKMKIDWPSIKTNWPHLQDLDLPAVDLSKVSVLIGRNVREAHDVLEQRKGGTNGPDAIRTPFGWCVAGPIPKMAISIVQPKVHLVRTASFDCDLRDYINKLWEDDKLTSHQPIRIRLTDEEKRAIHHLQSTIRHTGERWEVGLMWKTDLVKLPNNYTQALKYFQWQETKLAGDPVAADKYDSVIREYIALGYAVPVADSEPTNPGRTWYIPHHAVTNPRKPGKLRVVFNCSATFRSHSLNGALLKGPDLLVNSVGVLLRFRHYRFAAAADIKGMYHQVAVPRQDQSALRFLYRKPGSEEGVKQYQMTRHVFGAVSSPTTCIFALNRTADEFGEDCPAAKETIKTNTYVDNVFLSHDNEDILCNYARQTQYLCARGGFHLCQVMSNSRKLLKQFNGSDLSIPLDLAQDRLPTESALGIMLNWETDCFVFRVNVQHSTSTTMRQVLKVTAAMYDPLGFLAVAIISSRIIFQDCWRAQLMWDDELPPSLQARWSNWTKSLQHLNSLELPRNLRVHANPLEGSLHVFSDASDLAYGAGVYYRALHLNGDITVRLIIGKAKVAPLRQQSIPRLELKGAVLGAQLVALAKAELNLGPGVDVTYWTDSVTVLRWIYATATKYHAFVAHRITEILDLSSASQWRHVPGELNPADDASRGIMTESLSPTHRWFTGPTFLRYHPSAWPSLPGLPEPSELDPEVRPIKWAGLICLNPCDKLFSYSHRVVSWERYIHVIGWLVRFVRNLSAKPGTPTDNSSAEPGKPHQKPPTSVFRYLNPSELRHAKALALRLDQQKFFSTELMHIQKGKSIPSSSKLNQITPFVDNDGILRVRGRIERGDYAEFLKHPIVLHHESPVARLIITETHERIAHERVEATIAALRSEYYVLRFRQTVQRVLNKCPSCRIRLAQPAIPLMAALPPSRLKSHLPPFTLTGLDFFGPFDVMVFRRTVKRYGVLFTCMTTRAVHIEMAYALDTETFLLSFWRFANRRGCPSEVYSDNGTNFVAGNKELQSALKSLETNVVADRLARRFIKWCFNPPAAPHFGGSWERLIQSAKRALTHVVNGQILTDDGLSSALVAVENLLNSRPLTHIAVDPREPEPLTPNHFLIGRPNINPVPDHPSTRREPSLKTWRRAQTMATHFWNRWRREYVPNLIERRKWLVKRRNLAIGDFVLIMDSNAPRGEWPSGLVVRVYPGADGVVRSARIRTKTGEFERPVSKICLLEYASDENVSDRNRAGNVTDADSKTDEETLVDLPLGP